MNEPNFKFQISNFKLIRRFLFLFAGFIIFPIFYSAAQTPENSPTVKPPEVQPAQNFHRWGAVTLFSGLPSDNVRAIAQTDDGVLWFGTDNGLARFDGRRVQTFAVEDSAANKILALAVSVSGEIWIGTEAGAARFSGGAFYPIEETRGKPISRILAGEITILVSPDAIFAAHHKPDNSLEVVTLINRQLAFSDALRNDDGTLVFATLGRGLIVTENGEPQEVMSRPRPFFINALRRAANGNLWIGAKATAAESGLFTANDIFRPRRIGEIGGTITAFGETENGDLLIGTEQNGLFRFRGENLVEHFTFENTAGGLRSNTIYSIFVDRENVIWTGTNRGASRFDQSSAFNRTLSENANSNFVRAVFRRANGEIFAGTNRGLFALTENGWREAVDFPAKIVYSITETAAGQTLFTAPGGIYTLDGKQIFTGDVRAAAEFQNKTYAAVFGSGVTRIENQTGILADDAPTALFADREKLWIGTARNGIFTFDGRETRSENALADLRGAAIWKITKGGGNDVWIAAERGLFLFRNGALQEILRNEDVRDLVVRGADVWAATLKSGLYHLKFDEQFGWLKSQINVEQGLPSEQIFAICPDANRLLIGTNRGITAYIPGAVAPKIAAARVLSQRLHAPGELFDLIALEYPQNSLVVEVAGISSRTFPEQFQYGFALAGSDGRIIEKKLSNDAQFTPADLPPGEYSVKARAFNKDLLASEPLIIRFSVARAPFPRTATALGVLLVIALIALIWALIERRRIKQKNRELARARFDLANEAERERKRIARDLHDQTLADLRQLMMMSDDLPAETGEFRREIESVSTEIRRICEDLSPSVLENVGLLAALEFLVSHTTQNYEFSAADNLEERLNFSPNVEMQIYRIAQEVLTNIKRHSDAKSIEMKIEVSTENEFVLMIADDGTNFDANAAAGKGRGIANIKSRAALIDAEIIWETLENGGTVFKLKAKVRA